MSIKNLAYIAAGYSRSMDMIALQARDPTLVQDPARMAIFQQQLMHATNGYQLAARTMQDMHREDQTLADMLRDV